MREEYVDILMVGKTMNAGSEQNSKIDLVLVTKFLLWLLLIIADTL